MRHLIPAAFCIICVSCAGPHAPRGFLEVQRVTSAARVFKGREADNWGVGLNVLFPLTSRWSIQMQPVAGFNGTGAFRAAVVCQIF